MFGLILDLAVFSMCLLFARAGVESDSPVLVIIAVLSFIYYALLVMERPEEEE